MRQVGSGRCEVAGVRCCEVMGEGSRVAVGVCGSDGGLSEGGDGRRCGNG